MESVYFGQILANKFDLLQKGMQVHQHKHEYDHLSILVSGSVSVYVDNGPENIYTAPSVICIKKYSNHKIVARSDNTVWFCIFSLRDIDGNPSDQFLSIHMPKSGDFLSGTEPVSGYRNQILYYDNEISNIYSIINDAYHKIEEANLRLEDLVNTESNKVTTSFIENNND